MTIRELDCPACGSTVDVGVPREATIVAVRAEPAGSDDAAVDCRHAGCPNGHVVEFCFRR